MSMPYKTVEVPLGTRFGRWVSVAMPVLRPRADGRNRSAVLCRCDCGTEREVTVQNLRTGISGSCGCLHRERASEANTTHGATAGAPNNERPRLYRIWRGMRDRCYRQNAENYRWYGAKGVGIHPAWRDDFKAFQEWSLLNGYENLLEIDRIDSSKNYEPANCRWVTKAENLQNSRCHSGSEEEVMLHVSLVR